MAQKIQFKRRYKVPGAMFDPGMVVEISDENHRGGRKILPRNAELALRGGAAVPYTEPPPEPEGEGEDEEPEDD